MGLPSFTRIFLFLSDRIQGVPAGASGINTQVVIIARPGRSLTLGWILGTVSLLQLPMAKDSSTVKPPSRRTNRHGFAEPIRAPELNFRRVALVLSACAKQRRMGTTSAPTSIARLRPLGRVSSLLAHILTLHSARC